MSWRFLLRRGTAANWTSVNPILAAGEPGYETDTGKMKMGDGSTVWTSLSYHVDRVFTNAEKTKLAGIADGAQVNPTRITSQERIDGTGTTVVGVAPVDVKTMIDLHAPSVSSGVTAFGPSGNKRTGSVTPATDDYSADQITETASRKFLTADERLQLALTGTSISGGEAATTVWELTVNGGDAAS